MMSPHRDIPSRQQFYINHFFVLRQVFIKGICTDAKKLTLPPSVSLYHFVPQETQTCDHVGVLECKSTGKLSFTLWLMLRRLSISLSLTAGEDTPTFW